jgi:hypothetical protein
VQRYPLLPGVQPHRSGSFRLSTDPLFIGNLRDVIGRYLDPPENALVLRALERLTLPAGNPSQ